MANYTDNLSLKKWDLTNEEDLSSSFDIDGTLNDNWDKVDEAIGANSTNIATNTSNIETLQNNATDISALEEEVERLRSDIESMAITEETEGETIYLTDASNARLTNIEIYGNTDDDGNSVEDSVDLVISNKNLLDTSNWKDQTVTDDEGNEFTIIRNEDGTFTCNGTYIGSAKHIRVNLSSVIPARLAKNCTLTIQIISGTSTEDGIRFYMWDENSGNRWVSDSNTAYKQLKELNYTAFSFEFSSNGTTCDNAVIGFQVEYGTSSTDYVEHESQHYSLPVQSAMTAEDYFDFDNMQEVHADGDTLDMTDEQKEIAEEIINTAKTYSTITNIYTTDTVGANIKVTYCKDISTIISNIQSTLETLTTEE